MKSAKTMNCKMCMVERKEILHTTNTNSSMTTPTFLQDAVASVDFISFFVLIQ
jgi:hypothetical protein